MKVVIPSKSNRVVRRKLNRNKYKQRHWVENFFCRVECYRRVDTRHEKTARNYLGFVLFAAIRDWLGPF